MATQAMKMKASIDKLRVKVFYVVDIVVDLNQS